MATNIHKIVLKGKGHHDEGTADEAVTPGMAVRMAADGDYDQETLAPDVAAGTGLCVVKEDALQGNIITTEYAIGDKLFLYRPLPGDHIHAFVKASEDIDVGDYLAVEGSGSGLFTEVSSSASAEYKLPITSAKVWDALQTTLPGTAADDDMAIVTGTPGTDAPSLQGVDFGGTTADEKCAFEFVLPHSYRAGAAVTVRLNAGVLTTISDGTATVDVSVYKDAGDGSVGSDLCATALQSINSLTMANKDFTITPTGFAAGDRLIIVVSLAASDTGNLGVMIQEIQNAAVLTGNAINAQLVALEDSGGALAANTHIRCRVLAL